MKKQVLVDMDGVLADVYSQFIDFEYRKTGVRKNIESLNGILESEAFPLHDEYVNSVGFFRNAPLIADSVEGLKYLNEKYKVLIVSSATEFPRSLLEKHEWLQEFFPFITWQQMIFCGKKDSIKGNIMIDDHPKNLDFFDGRRILFTQPHNALVENELNERVNNWKEIIELL